MKNILLMFLLCSMTYVNAQHWSAYGLKVSSENEEIVVKIIDDHFTKNKIEGITVSLFKIMFTPTELPITHTIVFSGNAEKIGKMYNPEFINISWQLFSSKINNFIDENVFSGHGAEFLSFGPETSLPISLVEIWKSESWDDLQKFRNAIESLRTKYPRDYESFKNGGIAVGGPTSEGNVYNVLGFPSYEDYLNRWQKNTEFENTNPSFVKEREKLFENINFSTFTLKTSFVRMLVKKW